MGGHGPRTTGQMAKALRTSGRRLARLRPGSKRPGVLDIRSVIHMDEEEEAGGDVQDKTRCSQSGV